MRVGEPMLLRQGDEEGRRDLLEHELACECDVMPEELARAERLERRQHGGVVVVDAANLPVPIAHPEDEVARFLALGVFEYLLRRARFPKLALVHIEHAAARVAGEAHLVRDDEHREAPLGEVRDDGEHLGYHLRIQRARRLVEQQDLGIHGQAAGDGHALALPAGKLVRPAERLVPQPDQLQQLQRLVVGLLLGHAQQVHGRHHEVLHDELVVEQGVVLEHHAHLLAHFRQVNVRCAHVDAIHDNLARGWRFQAVEAPDEGRLARARRADDGNDLALIHGGVHVLQGNDVGVFLAQVLYFYEAHRSSTPSILRGRLAISIRAAILRRIQASSRQNRK